MDRKSLRVCLTVDVEGDCPPYLDTFRGIEAGLDRVLSLLAAETIRGTFFVTGRIAATYPAAVGRIVSQGHELGSHGWSHRPFDRMDGRTAAREIKDSGEVLRSFAPVVSFRAPFLRFPDRYLGLLAKAGFAVDSSQAKYKWPFGRGKGQGAVQRLPVSTTSSVLRLPGWIRFPVLKALAPPVVLFVHPWEFVDLTRERLRFDCRFRTGAPAVACLQSVIGFFRARKARFLTVGQEMEESPLSGAGRYGKGNP